MSEELIRATAAATKITKFTGAAAVARLSETVSVLVVFLVVLG
jgi:hypothetical protein